MSETTEAVEETEEVEESEETEEVEDSTETEDSDDDREALITALRAAYNIEGDVMEWLDDHTTRSGKFMPPIQESDEVKDHAEKQTRKTPARRTARRNAPAKAAPPLDYEAQLAEIEKWVSQDYR